MTKREMAKAMRKWADRRIARDGLSVDEELLLNGAAALEREAEREEQQRPSYSLKEQIDDIESEFHGTDTAGNAAADTLRKLDEEGGKLYRVPACDLINELHKFLRSLGVEPKP